MIHLRTISRQCCNSKQPDEFPYNVPVIQNLPQLDFTSAVTFFVGENGSGKSTLLEAIACAVGSITVGSQNVQTDPTLAEVRKLAKTFKLTWNRRTRKGFFLRAEDFFGYVKQLMQVRLEFEDNMREVDQTYQGRSQTAIGFAKMPYARELQDLERRYGDGLDTNSHGESFLSFFQSRFIPGGLYLLDEPEAPLSPLRQLGFISLLKQMVDDNAQFIISTHSPIIMAFPGAAIFSFDKSTIQPIRYENVEHVSLMKAFLNNPELYLQHL